MSGHVVVDLAKLPGGGQCIWHDLPSGERCPEKATEKVLVRGVAWAYYCAAHYPRRFEPVPEVKP